MTWSLYGHAMRSRDCVMAPETPWETAHQPGWAVLVLEQVCEPL